ncbi:MAG: tryptophan synthase subunit alpha [Aeromicrobium sp.]
MTALSDRLTEIRAEGRAAVVGYLPAGFPTLEGSIKAVEAMVDGGIDIVEVGLPYSDPVMDGPTIQAAAEQALAEAGGSGLITPDLIPDEAGEWTEAAKAHSLDQIFLVAPSSTDSRLAMTAEAASGFIYATAVMGVTGQREQTSSLAPALVARLRDITDKPVGVGLGVSNGRQAAEVGKFADAVIVGSALVRCLLDAPDEAAGLDAIRALAQDLRSGVERTK